MLSDGRGEPLRTYLDDISMMIKRNFKIILRLLRLTADLSNEPKETINLLKPTKLEWGRNTL